MIFIVRMAMREIRASWQRLLFFFICIAIGVGSIVALRSVIQSVRVALAGEARTLLGRRRAVTTNRAWTQAVLDTLEAEQRAGRVTLAVGDGRDPDDGAARGVVESGGADGGAAGRRSASFRCTAR